MMRRMGLLLTLLAAPAFAQLDDLPSGRRAVLEWDGVGRGGAWLAGPAPGGHLGSSVPEVVLAPGESALLRMAPRSLLRVVGEGEARLEVSEDGRLFAEWPLVDGGDGRSRLVETPFDGSWLARLSNPGERPLTLAPFASRTEVLGEPPQYLDHYPLEGGAVGLAVGEGERAQPFHTLDGDGERRVTLNGPLRLALESRRLFGGRDRSAEADYRLFVELDGAPVAVHAFEAAPERRRVARLEGQAVTVGEARHAYLELPAGEHQLALRASAPVLLRLLGREAAPDTPPPGDSLWMVEPDPTDLSSPARAERAARRLARDNGSREGALAARALVGRLAAAHSDRPELARLTVGRNASFQELPPREATRFTTLRFATPRLLRPGEARRLVLGEGLLANAADRLGRARFARLTPQGLSFPVAEAGGGIRLLALPGQRPWTIELSRDGGGSRRLVVEPSARVDEALYQYDEGLSAVELAEGGPRLATLLGEAPAPLGAVAAIELPLPPGEGALRLRGDGWVALEQRRSHPYRLDEAEGLALARRLEGAPFDHFVRLLRGDRRFAVQVAALPDEARARRLLGRLRGAGFEGELRAGHGLHRVVAGPVASRAGARELATALGATGFETLIVEREAAAPEGSAEGREALAALENQWRPLVRLLRARYRRFADGVVAGVEPLPSGPPLAAAEVARLTRRAGAAEGASAVERWAELARGTRGEARGRALLALADALAAAGEVFLAERLLRARALAGDREAWARLAARVDEDQRELLLSAALVAEPTPERAARLAERFAFEGQWRSALLLASLPPESHRPRDAVLSAALALGEQRSFEAALPGGDAPLWRGHWAVRHGDPAEALERYREAGAEAWRGALEGALALRARLADPDPAIRRAALGRWAEALERWPGGRVWRPVEVAGAAGGALLHNRELDLRTPLVRGEPGRPVSLELIGPARLRLALRPLHPATGEASLDGWVALGVDGASWRVPFTGNLPSDTLVVEGERARPGGEWFHELSLGPGLHRIELAPEAGALLAAVERALPAPVAPPLPPVTPALVAAVDDAPMALGDAAGEHLFSPRRLVTLDGREVGLPDEPFTPPSYTPRAVDYPAGEPPRFDADPLAGLVAEAERHPERRPALLVEAEALSVAGSPGGVDPGLLRRLTEGARWEPLRDLEGGEGVRGVATRGFGVESPALRARAALLPPAAEGEELLAVGGSAGAELFSPGAGRLTLRLALDRVAFLPGGPLTLRWSLDDGPQRRLTLTPERPRRSVPLALAPGAHYLSVAVESGPANHFLRLALEGEAAPPPVARHYAIATAEAPLHAHLEGPAWLRIDELRDGEVVSRYRRVASGWQRLTLRPQAGREEALLRLFRRVPGEGERVEPTRLAGRAGEPPPPLAPMAEPEAPAPFRLRDGRPLEETPAGTWSYGLQWNRRVGGDEEEGGDEDRFVELSVDHRRFRPWPADWLAGGALLRLRDGGEATVGLRGSWRTPWERAGLDLTLDGTLHAQPVAGEGAWAARLAATLGRRVALSPRAWHLPRATLFARALSHGEGAAPGDGSEVVDRDVWSRYKAQHRHGLRLEDTLTLRANADREWYGGARLTTNPGLDGVDHLRLRAGVRQHLGGWWLEGELRHTRYLADDDRSREADRPALDLRVGGEGWRDRFGRLEWGVRWLADLDSGDDSLLLTLQWHDGRGYRDFAPGEVDFRARRESGVPPEPRHELR